MVDLTTLFSSIELPPLLTQFIITVVLSLIIGLELHSYRRANEQDLGFGTTRTFALIGMSGFVLYMIDNQLMIYLIGLICLIFLLGIYYFHRCKGQLYSLLGPLLAVLTYLIAPVLIRFPDWFAVLYVVTILLMLSEKSRIRRFSDTFHSAEMVTFTKFLIMAGVVLPLLPDRQISSLVSVTYYQVWAALLVVSSLSYLSYLAQNYLFKEKGLLLTGLLGGLYSSTATTIVLARRTKGNKSTPQVTQAIILATTMMYLRLLILVFFLGHVTEAKLLLPPFLLFITLSLLAVWYASRIPQVTKVEVKADELPLSHPLEFKTALVFAGLFVAFTALTSIIITRYGSDGLHVLSFVVGLTDIDPFILSLLGGSFKITETQLVAAIIIASGSNNLIKAGYTLMFGRNRFSLVAAVWLLLLFIASLAYVFIFLG
jgi:uncharacterized membrane protein (DUF4010 family)